ncbi:MAG TPA: hypothetical protein PL048_23850 [Leptospiraceae bacterium]|nr:hypothetical protein [Leptospiraceae bacterium]HNO25450.1 hypothetical protein [Leptospiraceae bacterium]
MKSLTIKIPASMEAILDKFVSAGFFKSEEELFLIALSDFIRRNQIELMEYFASEDIKWAFQKNGESD